MDLSVNVAILSYNRGDYLREAVASVFEQTKAPREVFVFDNGSDGSVAEAIRPWIESGQVQWRGSEKNRGVHWNLARAFAEGSKGSDCLYVMHDDDRLCPTFLERQTAFLAENPSVVAVACNAWKIDEKGHRQDRLLSLLHIPWIRKKVELFKNVPEMVRLYSWSFIAFPSVVYRSSIVPKVKIVPEAGQIVDVFLMIELAREGTIAYQNELLWEYRMHKRQDSSHITKQSMYNRDKYHSELSREFFGLKKYVFIYSARRALMSVWKIVRRHIGYHARK